MKNIVNWYDRSDSWWYEVQIRPYGERGAPWVCDAAFMQADSNIRGKKRAALALAKETAQSSTYRCGGSTSWFDVRIVFCEVQS